MNKSKIIFLFLIVLLCGDFVYSSLQYYHSPLWGDLEGGILPGRDVQKIIDDPFGVNMIFSGEKHINPNRFFSHFFFMEYFQNIPILLQNFVEPISSVYLSIAIFKIILQYSLIYLLAVFITGEKKIIKNEFLIGAVLMFPLFQTFGYNGTIGIIDKSVAYSFFYALPLMLLLLFYLPFFKILYKKEKVDFGVTNLLLLIPLAFILPLSGPLIPGIVLVTSVILLSNFFVTHLYSIRNSIKKLTKNVVILFVLINLLSIYSLFLSLYDSNYISHSIPIINRYMKLPIGLFNVLTRSLGFPLLIITIGINMLTIKKHFKSKAYQKFRVILKWVGIFSIVYIILLPLGGYRPYRENTIRYDTFMPITICIFYLFGVTTYFLLQNLESKRLRNYILGISVLLLIYTFEDTSELNENNFEKYSLEYIANSPDEIVCIPYKGNIMSWNKITDYKESEPKAELLMLWNITDEKKLFYQNEIK